MCVKCKIWDHSLIFSLVCFIFVVESLVTGMMFLDTIEILLVRELFWTGGGGGGRGYSLCKAIRGCAALVGHFFEKNP